MMAILSRGIKHLFFKHISVTDIKFDIFIEIVSKWM